MASVGRSRRTQRSRPARIVSVCVAGRPVTQERHNENRAELVSWVVRQIRKRDGWGELDAVLFPAGFFRLQTSFGPLSAPERQEALSEAPGVDITSTARPSVGARRPTLRRS